MNLTRLALLAVLLAADARAAAPPGRDILPITKLAPAVLVPDLCVLRYRIATTSPKCQAYFDQGLGYFYSYVWREAARSFETAVRHDPNCAMAHWGLARALERFGRGNANASYQKAWDLRAGATPREQLLLRASMEQKGLIPGVGDAEARKKKAIATLDNLLAIYDDDEEAWFFRSQLAGGSGLFGGQASAVPFYKALLRINPLHPGANHELVHFYENFRRPALGWPHAESYIRSSPGIPHPFHMQAHLATRLGRWKLTSDRSTRAIQLEREYHKRENVKPREDSQFSHHLEVLLLGLIHDGRFAEGRAIMKEMQGYGYNNRETFFRLLLAERDYPAALALAKQIKQGKRGRSKGKGARRGGNKGVGSYCEALAHLAQKEPAKALPELEVLRQAARSRNDRAAQQRLQEVQGLYLCQTGDGAAGLKLLRKLVDKSKDDYGHHAWGNGASHMEAWGEGALIAGKLDVADEAFHEALAHDPGSVRAALGMQAVCERMSRTEEALRYASLARRCWPRADPGHLEAELAAARGQKAARPDPTKKP